jgi:hypothetical protein
MVVGYYDIPFRREKQMMGVVLAGMALSSHPDQGVQLDFEQWLKRSESAAHDAWSEKSRNLPTFRGAKAQIQAIDAEIKQALKSIFHGDATIDGTGAPALAQLLQWPGAGTGSGPRPPAPPNRRALTIDYPSEHAGWRANGDFEVVVRIGWSRAGQTTGHQLVDAAFAAVIVDDRDVAMPIAGATVVELQIFDNADMIVSGITIDELSVASRRFDLPPNCHARARVRVLGSSRWQHLGVQLQIATEAGVVQ